MSNQNKQTVIYPSNFEQKIGFDKVRALLYEKCLSPLGKERVEQLFFSTRYNEIEKWLHETAEFTIIERGEEDFPADYFFDLRAPLQRIKVEGTYMDERELFDLHHSLQTLSSIVAFFTPQPDEQPRYPYLYRLAGEVELFPHIITQIESILDKYGRVKDNASPELQRIRREITATISSISRNLTSILRAAQADGYIEKDVTPTLRDGRLVIPVNPTHKRKIRGIVHDESASGKTVFIEPAEVVEANNKVRELENEELKEVMRILIQFASTLRPHIEELLHAYLFMAAIDFIRAKALFAIQIEGEMPVVEDCIQMDWIGAIHPLLYLSLQKQHKKVEPLVLSLNEKQRIVLISGPNAGGKSVCLKTVGLLQYMIQCGLLVSMHSNSRVGIFQDIFIDIGDEQSIENDLSTYSSHLTNMKQFVRNCGQKSLLLIDEFGSGTEPQIGGAIAQSLLERFNQKGSYGVITTHYQNLKHYAEDTEGIVNGAMLYDRHLMQPLFKLSIGNPGSSFAIEIARKIGLPDEIIAQASAIVGSDYIDMDKYLQDIVRDKRYWEGKRENVRRKEKQLEEQNKALEERLAAITQERKEILKASQEEAKNLLARSNAEIEKTIRVIKEAQADKEKTKEVRAQLTQFKAEVENILEKNDDHINRKIEKLQAKERNKKQPPAQPSTPHKIATPATPLFAVGDAVRMIGQTSAGKILEIQGKNATIAFGSVKSTLPLKKIEQVNKNLLIQKERKATFVSEQTAESMHATRLNFRGEIDVRGMRGEEALQAVTYFIDDALQVNAGRVRILHGTGTGILRQIIRQYLASQPYVTHFSDEHVQLGGAGITIVELG